MKSKLCQNSKYSVSAFEDLGTVHSAHLGPNSAKVGTPKGMVKDGCTA